MTERRNRGRERGKGNDKKGKEEREMRDADWEGIFNEQYKLYKIGFAEECNE